MKKIIIVIILLWFISSVSTISAVNNDSIFNNKELNTSKSNRNICDNSREDNFLINPVPESKQNKDYNIMLLIPLLLVLLGAIILYKIKK